MSGCVDAGASTTDDAIDPPVEVALEPAASTGCTRCTPSQPSDVRFDLEALRSGQRPEDGSTLFGGGRLTQLLHDGQQRRIQCRRGAAGRGA